MKIAFNYKQWQCDAMGYGMDEEGADKVTLIVRQGKVIPPTERELEEMHELAWCLLTDKYMDEREVLPNTYTDGYWGDTE